VLIDRENQTAPVIDAADQTAPAVDVADHLTHDLPETKKRKIRKHENLTWKSNIS
jgi:hypothetical protein